MSGIIHAVRTHEIDTGHRVVGQGGKCERLHGHRYRIGFYCQALDLDDVGRVVDFSVIKERLCAWLEQAWDHKTLVWENDPWLAGLQAVDAASFVVVPWNPTAENMAKHLCEIIGPAQLAGSGVELVRVDVHETGKCWAAYRKGDSA